MNRLLAALIAVLVAGAAGAQTYRWVDKDGKVQYGDNPPPGAKVTRLKPPPAGVSSGEAPSPSAKKDEKKLTPEQAFQKRQKDAKEQDEKAAKERADAESKRSNCASAQASLRQIQNGQRLTTTNAQGERVFLDDEARGRELQRAQKAVSEWCG